MKSYLKFLSRHKLYTAVEAAGLIVSIAFVILIGNHILQHRNISRENPEGNRVYAVIRDRGLALSWWDKPVFEDRVPEAEAVCRVGHVFENYYWAEIGDRKAGARLTEIDASFFEVFPNYRLLRGNPEEFLLKDRCYVSESFARANWDGDPVGRSFECHDPYGARTLTVCGVFADFRNAMMPETELLVNADFNDVYGSGRSFAPFSRVGSHMTLIKVRPDTDRAALEEKVRRICEENYDPELARNFSVVTLPELYFADRRSGHFAKGDKSMQRILLAVVLLLLVSAVFNYINLNLALSGRRAKEMATRRLLGSSREAVALKYVAESLVFTAVCFALALLLAYALLPPMDRLLAHVAGEGVGLRLEWSPGMMTAYAAGLAATGVLAGLVPAWFASRFAPIDIVRGTFRRRSRMLFSKAFIIFQNTVSVVLVAMAIVMEVQLHHMAVRPLNVRTEGLYNIYHPARNYDELAPLADRLERIPGVKRTAYGQGIPGSVLWEEFEFGLDEGPVAKTQMILCNEDYFDMLELKVVEDWGMSRTGSVWLSRSLAAELGVDAVSAQPYADAFRINGAKITHVGGVYEDFPTADVLQENTLSNSVVIVGRNEDMRFVNGLMIEVSGHYKETGEAIKAAYADFVREQSGVYIPSAQNDYVIDIINRCLKPAKTTMRLVEVFMLLSVLIALLGLVAMSAYFSGENTKGIAVRKVFGSDVRRELFRTVAEYMRLVAVAVAVGIPVSVYAAARFLSRYPYRIGNYGWIFVVAAAFTVSIAFLSVFWQTFRAARTNPAVELKKE